MTWLSDFAEKHAPAVDLEFLDQWLTDVRSKRDGSFAGWDQWSPECKAGWAKSMIDLLEDEGLTDLVPDETHWLERITRMDLLEVESGVRS